MAQHTTAPSANANTILIHKRAGERKDAIRVRTEADIPDFLFGTVTIDPFAEDDKKIVLECVEYEEGARCPLGSVIGYEPSEATSTGWNAWCIGNAATSLVEVDGVFYKKAITYQAQEVTEVFPEFLRGADIVRNPDGSWSITTNWGISTGFPGAAYWVLYDIRDDDTLSANILTKTERSFSEYVVADEDGNDICSLPEWDEQR